MNEMGLWHKPNDDNNEYKQHFDQLPQYCERNIEQNIIPHTGRPSKG